ncbi:MAG: energy coupling factor transporter S component ThiW [Lachnospiraceae bacterium]|nr:energy coupling factor transporter S component ThiW [Lachnospiraceae bacterium]
MKFNLKKLTVAGMLVALTVTFSTFCIPVGAAKCYPIQHVVNVLAAVFLGPVYGVIMAFCTSLIRNILGTGSLLAFPGSMIGAFLAGFLYQKSGKLVLAYLGEVIGTGIIGGILCYPVATFLMGKEAALFMYVIPFLASTMVGTFIAFVMISALYKSKAFNYLKQILEGTTFKKI